MTITFLGHAGWLVETDDCYILMDPWLSRTGAYFQSWWQLPANDHLVPWVLGQVSRSKRVFVYISHEHQDHFDEAFLRRLPPNVEYIVARYREPGFANRVKRLPGRHVHEMADGHRRVVTNGETAVTIYAVDDGMERDSGILVEHVCAGPKRFLNINDAKLFGRLQEIAPEGVNVFTCQFSGAIWHPVCYDYDEDKMLAVGKAKTRARWEVIEQAIATMAPAVYVPSAGPPAFLDPELRRLNEWPCLAVFPRANEIAAHLAGKARVCVLLPGEALALHPGGIADAARLAGCENAWTIRDYQVEIETQSLRHADVFRDRSDSRAFVPDQLLERLELLVRAKLEALNAPETVLPSTRIYIGLDSHPDYLQVDLRRRMLARSPPPAGDETYYRLTVPTWVVAQLVWDGAKWEEMMLSMRVSAARRPDIYDLAIHGFLINEPEGMEQLARTLECAERASSKRVVVGGYEIDRNCPHMGTDLSDARIDGGCLICPRHGWRFDLRRGGQGIGNAGTINARKGI